MKPRTRAVRLKHPMPAGAGPFDHDVDPKDSDSLRRLRQIIDTELGWASTEDEEAGDYEARLREVAAELRRLRPLGGIRARLRTALSKVDALLTGGTPTDFDDAAKRAAEQERTR